jgi:hypothetical protein
MLWVFVMLPRAHGLWANLHSHKHVRGLLLCCTGAYTQQTPLT